MLLSARPDTALPAGVRLASDVYGRGRLARARHSAGSSGSLAATTLRPFTVYAMSTESFLR